MVMNYERHGFQNQSNLAGIAVKWTSHGVFAYKMARPPLKLSHFTAQKYPSFALRDRESQDAGN